MSGVIRKFIETTTPYNICAEESGGGEAIKKAREFGCDLVVLDLSMPGLNGAETASVLRRMLPRANIVRLTMFAREFKRGLFDASGFDLVLFKSDGLSKLAEAIKMLLAAPDDNVTAPSAAP